jgi:hypothetical protein
LTIGVIALRNQARLRQNDGAPAVAMLDIAIWELETVVRKIGKIARLTAKLRPWAARLARPNLGGAKRRLGSRQHVDGPLIVRRMMDRGFNNLAIR